jgi:hypothetical protein
VKIKKDCKVFRANRGKSERRQSGVSPNTLSIPEIDQLLGSLPENVWI